MKFKKFKSPIHVRIVKDDIDVWVPLSIMFLAGVVSITLILLVIV